MQSLAGQPRSPLLPKVDAYRRTAFRSYFAVGNPKNITRTLAEPHGRVLFAGEATSEKPATGEAQGCCAVWMDSDILRNISMSMTVADHH